MPKIQTRKEKIMKRAAARKAEVQSKKIKAMGANINSLEKRLEALEKGPN